MSDGEIEGRRIVITGATDGIGLATARLLAAQGARLVLHGRDERRLAAALAEIGGGAERVRADLASLAEVRALVDTLGGAPIDVLVQNAGIGAGPDTTRRQESSDGFELRWAVNFLAPFALAEWLVAAGHAPRAMVNVASIGQAVPDLEDLGMERHYEGWLAYRRAKLAMVAWTRELSRRHPELAVLSLHPGTFLATKMVTEVAVAPRGTVEDGARSVLAAVRRVLAGKGAGAFWDVDHEAPGAPESHDERLQLRLRALAAESVARFGGGLAIDPV
ncbi:MAG: SDR family NAD(P)-dependent oxidoreductase [Polyangiaceae bacterium]